MPVGVAVGLRRHAQTKGVDRGEALGGAPGDRDRQLARTLVRLGAELQQPSRLSIGIA
jgi:hypothetical protein